MEPGGSVARAAARDPVSDPDRQPFGDNGRHGIRNCNTFRYRLARAIRHRNSGDR
jgi:hypothetical protein